MEHFSLSLERCLKLILERWAEIGCIVPHSHPGWMGDLFDHILNYIIIFDSFFALISWGSMKSLGQAIRLRPDWAKAHSRKGLSLLESSASQGESFVGFLQFPPGDAGCSRILKGRNIQTGH